MTMTVARSRKREFKNNAIIQLNDLDIKQGETVWTLTEYVGKNGTAYVRAFIIRNGEPVNITWHIGHATSQTLTERGGRWAIRTGGYGYSRSQHVVDALSWLLFDKGGQLTDRDL